MWLHGVLCYILGSAAGVFSWHLPYVLLSFCFACSCWGAPKSPTPIACTLLSEFGARIVPLSCLGGSFVLQKGRLACVAGSHLSVVSLYCIAVIRDSVSQSLALTL